MASPLIESLPGLLKPWTGAPGKPVAGSGEGSKRQDRKALGHQLWEALHARDEAGVKEALQAGADASFSLNGMPPFWFTVQHQLTSLAQVLLEHGADPLALHRGASVWTALSPRDNVEEAQWLLGMLGSTQSAKASDFITYRAYRLFEWWMDNTPGFRLSEPSPGSWAAKNMQGYALAAIRGPERIWPLLNQQWRIDPSDVYSLIKKWGPGLAYATWEEIARRDDVVAAQRALSMGWGPPRVEDLKSKENDTAGNRPTPLYGSMGWYFFSKSAFTLWRWWVDQEALAREFHEDGRSTPNTTLFEVITDRQRLERLQAAGLDFSVRDSNGNTALHAAANGPYLSKALVSWWIQHRPQDFLVTNAQGHLPLEQPKGKNTKPAAVAQAKQLWMEHRLANEKTVEATKRSRL